MSRAGTMDFIETPVKPVKTTNQQRTKTMKKKIEATQPKQPKSIKLSTIWKALVYTFAVVGVILSVMYVNDIINDVVDSRAQVKVQEILKAQPATQIAPAASKTNQ